MSCTPTRTSFAATSEDAALPVPRTRRAHPRILQAAACCLYILCAIASGARSAHADTVIVPGGQWLGGTGVDVYKNIYSYPGPSSYLNRNGKTYYVGVKWQCVELAQRLYTALGWYLGSFGCLYPTDIYARASQLNMDAHPSGSGYIPVPGDLVVESSPNHVAVVNYVDANFVYVCEQNYSSTGRAQFQRQGHNGSLLARGSDHIQGVLHSHSNGYVPSPVSSSSRIYQDRLAPNQVLRANQGILSPSGRAILTMQSDGNLVMYSISGATWAAKWASNTQGIAGAWAIMQGDGNFVVYDAQGRPRWASNTNGATNSVIIMQNDGNVVIYDPYWRAIWASNTGL